MLPNLSNPFVSAEHRFPYETLLERDPIVLDQRNIRNQIRNSKILITGAAGSIGTQLALQICDYQPQLLILLDQSETALGDVEMHIRSAYPTINVNAFIANITDPVRIDSILRQFRPDIVFHAAAYKHVPIMEKHPYEAIRTNVLGTQILADLAIKYRVSKFIFISTDKAVNPSSVMGASKRLAEMYIQQTLHSGTQFIITRFGNVLGSNGSFISVFQKQIASGGPVTVTHPDASRYLMTIPEACQLVLEASAIGTGGQVLYFDMGKPVLIRTIAEKMIRSLNLRPNKVIEIIFTGLRPGEKLSEELHQPDELECFSIHPKIKLMNAACPANADFEAFNKSLAAVLSSSCSDEMVSFLKRMVPEYVSCNSDFERLDLVT
ncbi:polysaccharide biosynthesis protein [Dyadobacter sp. CY323]|uniref:polysaccharide biosynthesis protein n=1 Tax=Dyadobacter sp. CY323 TaxID=2907302 RepID=UPI001F33E793|nr:polysaccharide biosynthesis protein [Dyadobacter sp. CY323]MCE6989152.1 polysaccharide biosynthesis protein [Dyadobacter sp. CY323]